MAQLRQDHQQFLDRDAEVIITGPDNPDQFKSFWEKNQMSFIGLPDPKHVIAKQFKQPVKWFKLGRMPAIVIIDKSGAIRYEHFGNSMKDIPENQVLFDSLDKLNQNQMTN